MAKKSHIEGPTYVEASLKIWKDKFVELLRVQIEKGEKLLLQSVPTVPTSSSYGTLYQTHTRNHVNYDKTAQTEFVEAYKRWHDYNVEIYKTSFSVPNSTYRHDYESQVWTLWGGEDVIKEYKDEIRRLCNQMQADIEKIDLIPCIEEDIVVTTPTESGHMDKSNIFIVHGHDNSAINEVKVFLMNIGLNPIILREQPNEGQTIIEKIEKYTNVGFGIVIYTPCDEGKAKDASSYKDRARQNVVFEHGYLCARLGRSNVCALVSGDLELPGDLGGVVYTPMSAGWELLVVRELKAAGYKIDANKLC